MSNSKRFYFTAIVAVLLAALPLMAATYIPVVEWNGTQFHVMNGSGVYDLQPVDDPIVDVPFSNANSVVTWSDGTDDFTYVVDSFQDRVQLFSTNIEYVKESTADGDLTWGSAGTAGNFSATVINLGATGAIVRGSEQVIIGGTEYTRVSSIASYSAGDPYYTMVYEGADANAVGVITTPGTLTSSSVIVVKYAVVQAGTFIAASALTDDIDYMAAAASVNGAVSGSVFEINETIPNNTGHPTHFENLIAVETNTNPDVGGDVVDLYLLDAGEIGTVDPKLHAFLVEDDAAVEFDFYSTYNSPMSEPHDVAVAESGTNTLGILTYTVGQIYVDPATPPTATVTNNALFSGHDYRFTVIDGQDTPGADLDGVVFQITDLTTDNVVGYYEQTTTTSASDPALIDAVPGMLVTITCDGAMLLAGGTDLDFLVGTLADPPAVDPAAATTDDPYTAGDGLTVTVTTAPTTQPSADLAGAVFTITNTTTGATLHTYRGTTTVAGAVTIYQEAGETITFTTDALMDLTAAESFSFTESAGVFTYVAGTLGDGGTAPATDPTAVTIVDPYTDNDGLKVEVTTAPTTAGANLMGGLFTISDMTTGTVLGTYDVNLETATLYDPPTVTPPTAATAADPYTAGDGLTVTVTSAPTVQPGADLDGAVFTITNTNTAATLGVYTASTTGAEAVTIWEEGGEAIVFTTDALMDITAAESFTFTEGVPGTFVYVNVDLGGGGTAPATDPSATSGADPYTADDGLTVTVTTAPTAAGADMDGGVFTITNTTTGTVLGTYTCGTTIAATGYTIYDEAGESILFTPDANQTLLEGEYFVFTEEAGVFTYSAGGTVAGTEYTIFDEGGESITFTPDAGLTLLAAEYFLFAGNDYYDITVNTTPVNSDYIFIADTGNDRIKVVKGADNGVATTNGTTTDYFADDDTHQDYYGAVTSAIPNMTFVSAVRAMEDTYTIYSKTSTTATDSTMWTQVDNFAGSGASDKHFTYDYDTQVVMFGDGTRGDIPDAGLYLYAYYTPTLDVLDYGTTGSSDGNFNAPEGVDARWNAAHGWFDVYVSDTGNNRVAKLKFSPPTSGSDANMEWVTSWTTSFTGATLSEPTDLVVISDGQAAAADSVYLFVCDTGNDRVIVYRDADAENEGDGGSTVPTFKTVIGSNGIGLGQFSRPSGISVKQENNAFEIYVADSERNYVTKFMAGDDPDIEVAWDIDSYGYLPTGSYTFSKESSWTTMADNYPTGSYIMFYYSDTTSAGQASPILCSNSQYAASTTTSFTWTFASTPTGAPADGVYYLYAKLFDSNGILLDTDSSIGQTIAYMTIDTDLNNGIGAFDEKDADSFMYLQNGSIRQFILTAIYPDSVAAVSYTGSFPADKMQIVGIAEGPAWETVQHQNTIFESNYNNTTGTFEINTAVLGSSSGLVSGPPTYTVAIVTVQVEDDAISTSDRVYDGDIDITAGSWTDYKGVLLSTPTLNDLNVKIGYLGDIADSTGANRGTIPNMTPSPDGKFGINDLVVFTMAWNGRGGTQDMIADLAPYEGTSVPDIWSTPDGVLDVQDLMAFTAMFDWYNANVNTFSLPQTNPGVNPGDGTIASTSGNNNVRIETREEAGNLVLDIFAQSVEDLNTVELDVVFNSGDYKLGSYNQGDFLNADFFRGYSCETGLRLFLSNTNNEGASGSGKLAEVVFTPTGENSDLIVGFDLRNTDGNVIDAGSANVLKTALPTEFCLNAAYPNPFNSMTKLTFGMTEAGNVKVAVYDVHGRMVANLVNGEAKAGYHTAVWNAGNAAAGLYLVRMETAGFTGVQKVMLVK